MPKSKYSFDNLKQLDFETLTDLNTKAKELKLSRKERSDIHFLRDVLWLKAAFMSTSRDKPYEKYEILREISRVQDEVFHREKLGDERGNRLVDALASLSLISGAASYSCSSPWPIIDFGVASVAAIVLNAIHEYVTTPESLIIDDSTKHSPRFDYCSKKYAELVHEGYIPVMLPYVRGDSYGGNGSLVVPGIT